MIPKSEAFSAMIDLIRNGDSEAFDFCKGIVDALNGNNNGFSDTNGEYALARRYIPKSKIVFDIGMNYGEWSRYALSLNNNIDLHCFEPIEYYCQRAKQSDLGARATINHLAVCEKIDETTFYAFGEGSGGSSLYRQDPVNDGISDQITEIKTNTTTIDEYCSMKNIDRVDYMKIDVEGAEFDVLSGAIGMFSSRKIGMATIEYGVTWISARRYLMDIFEFSEKVGYCMLKIHSKQLVHHDKYDKQQENYQYQNWVIADPDFLART